MSVEHYFGALADFLTAAMTGKEIFTAYLQGESSDFCRFNQSKIRQAGTVEQNQVTLTLINGRRNAEGSVTLCQNKDEDTRRLQGLLTTLREQLPVLPDDPYLLYATEVHSSSTVQKSAIPDVHTVVDDIAAAGRRLDLVGIYAAGAIYRGFANSFGQRNWYETYSFNLDWSFYLRADKAVKTGYAGVSWDPQVFAQKVANAQEQMAVLEKEAVTLNPGRYRVYLSPSALIEVTDMMGMGGFSLKEHRTKQTPFIRMVASGARMNPAVSMYEHTAGGIAPNFDASGFTKAPRVTLIESGAYKDCLVSPRSAQEYGVPTNGAAEGESPQSLEIAAGTLALDDVVRTLDDGIYINNLWYLNFSDVPAFRVTGMTRFASFLVKQGKIVQPLNVMRFDESVLRMFGDKLVAMTREREMLLSTSTYNQRSTSSVLLPGMIVDDFSFTL